MVEEDIKGLEKEVLKRKRLVSEWAGKMHDLAEERLPHGFAEIHEIAEGTYIRMRGVEGSRRCAEGRSKKRKVGGPCLH